jgi:hypothetical protein
VKINLNGTVRRGGQKIEYRITAKVVICDPNVEGCIRLRSTGACAACRSTIYIE